MTSHRSFPRLLAAAAAGLFIFAAVAPATAGQSSSSGGGAGSGYNAIPSKVSGNVSSLGFEAASADEFGDLVGLGGKGRRLDSISVLMSSWACESGSWNSGDCHTTPGATFDVPITFSIYDSNGVDVLAEETATIAIPYRPSASEQCTGEDAGKWYNSKDRLCYNGYPYRASVDMSDQAVDLPEQVIWSVQYNTTTSGYHPIGDAPCVTGSEGCGYDSLNVGAFSFANAPFAGVDVDPDAVFIDGAIESGWAGFRPLGAISTR